MGWHPGPTPRQHQSSHALPQPRCTQTPPPSTVFRFPALHLPQGCAPTHPLPPVSRRQLQSCPLLREQVDSDAQSHKPWVGTSFFSVSLSSSPPSLVVYPSSPLWSSCLPHCPSSFPSFALCTPLNSQNDMFFSLPEAKFLGPHSLHCPVCGNDSGPALNELQRLLEAPEEGSSALSQYGARGSQSSCCSNF